MAWQQAAAVLHARATLKLGLEEIAGNAGRHD
jgi:hypothetical protein